MRYALYAIFFPALGPVCGLVAMATLIRPRRWRPAVKVAASLAVVAASMKFTWFHVFGGNMFWPELPAAAIHTLSVAYDVVLMLAPLGIVASVASRAGARAAAKAPGGLRRRDFIVGCMAAATVPAATATVHAGIRLPKIRPVELEFDDLPPAFDGYRIVHMSDLHISAAARADRTAGVVRLANSLKPDLIVITGDIVDGKVSAHRQDVEPLGELSARDGVLGCNGNHEYYLDSARWAKEFARLGVRMLRNEETTIRRARADGSGYDEISVIGRNDPVSRNTDIRAAAAVAAPFKVLLVHRPTKLEAHAALGVRLQLSGHTHGGAILGLDRLVARANEGHVRGLYREHGVTLYVNAGTGQWAGFPERAGISTEITEITLRRRAGRIERGGQVML